MTTDNKQPSDRKEEVPDDFDDLDENEFTPCDLCDGHDACADFGCAFELGLGRMVKKDIQPGFDDWS